MKASSEVADCRSCKQAMAKEGRNPRPLRRLPTEVTQHKVFQRKGLPVSICDHCDGAAYESAMRYHTERADK